jgi:hypothetical protein
VLFFAGWKQHYSLYPATDLIVEVFKEDLVPYEVNDKGTIRFPHSRPVPVKLIERIARFRAKEAADDARAKLAASKEQYSLVPVSSYIAACGHRADEIRRRSGSRGRRRN